MARDIKVVSILNGEYSASLYGNIFKLTSVHLAFTSIHPRMEIYNKQDFSKYGRLSTCLLAKYGFTILLKSYQWANCY